MDWRRKGSWTSWNNDARANPYFCGLNILFLWCENVLRIGRLKTNICCNVLACVMVGKLYRNSVSGLVKMTRYKYICQAKLWTDKWKNILLLGLQHKFHIISYKLPYFPFCWPKWKRNLFPICSARIHYSCLHQILIQNIFSSWQYIRNDTDSIVSIYGYPKQKRLPSTLYHPRRSPIRNVSCSLLLFAASSKSLRSGRICSRQSLHLWSYSSCAHLHFEIHWWDKL